MARKLIGFLDVVLGVFLLMIGASEEIEIRRNRKRNRNPFNYNRHFVSFNGVVVSYLRTPTPTSPNPQVKGVLFSKNF
jgi:hypothetical protein